MGDCPWLSLGFGGAASPWRALQTPHSNPSSLLRNILCVCLSLSPLLIQTLGIASRPTLLQDDPMLTRLHLPKPHFQIRLYAQLKGLGTQHIFWGHTSPHGVTSAASSTQALSTCTSSKLLCKRNNRQAFLSPWCPFLLSLMNRAITSLPQSKCREVLKNVPN